MTLYDRIGGHAAVSAAVDEFYIRVLNDPLLAPFFESTDIDRLKRHQFAFLSQAMGGPRQYSGASMARAHARLCIEQRHFDAVVSHLGRTLRHLRVSEQLIGEVVTAVTPLAQQVVNTAGAVSA